jgi:hypothetical protein
MSAFAQRKLRCSRLYNQQSLCQHQLHKNRYNFVEVGMSFNATAYARVTLCLERWHRIEHRLETF